MHTNFGVNPISKMFAYGRNKIKTGKALPSLAPFGEAVSEEKIFLTLANQKQELPLATIFVGGNMPCNFEVNLITRLGVIALFFVKFSKC
jgi:hypothetical protein